MLLALLGGPSGLASGPDAPSLEQLLAQIGQRVETFWQEFPRVTCSQTIVQSKLDEKGKVLAQQQAEYDYTVSLALNGSDLAMGESLVPKAAARDDPGEESLLLTQGFATMILIFHPNFQPRFRFLQEPDERLQGRLTHKLRFEQKEDSPSLSLLRVHAQDYPLEWQGAAWVDVATQAVVRIETGLKKSMEDVGLISLTSEVTYNWVQHDGAENLYWLPKTALVEAHSRRQHWRNSHRFDRYKWFTVDTRITIEGPQ